MWLKARLIIKNSGYIHELLQKFVNIPSMCLILFLTPPHRLLHPVHSDQSENLQVSCSQLATLHRSVTSGIDPSWEIHISSGNMSSRSFKQRTSIEHAGDNAENYWIWNIPMAKLCCTCQKLTDSTYLCLLEVVRALDIPGTACVWHYFTFVTKQSSCHPLPPTIQSW